MPKNRIETLIQKEFIKWCFLNWHRWPDASVTITHHERVAGRTIKVRVRTLAFFHPPNGGARDGKTGSLMRDMGVRPGVLDLWLPVPRGSATGLVIELKAPGGRLSPDQREWIDFLTACGWKVNVSQSIDECIAATTSYLDRA